MITVAGMNGTHQPHSLAHSASLDSGGEVAGGFTRDIREDHWPAPAFLLNRIPQPLLWVPAKLLLLAVNDSISTVSDH